MAAELGELHIKVTTDTNDAKSNLKDLNSEAGKSGGFFSDAASHVLGFVGAFAGWETLKSGVELISDGIKDVVNTASQASLVTAQMNQALKSTHDASGETAEALEKLATGLSTTTMFSKDTIESAQNMLLTFTNIGSKTFPQATKTALDMAQALGGDAKQQALQLGIALNDPEKGIGRLTRVGVTFTDSQKNLIKSLQDSGNMAGAQAVVLQELQKEFGGSAEAAGKTLPGQLAILQNSFENIKENVGNALIPVLTQLLSLSQPLISAFGTVLVGALTEVAGWITDLSGVITQASSPLNNTGAIVKTLGDTFTGVFSSLQTDAQPFIQSLVGGFTTLKPLFMLLVNEAIGLLPVFQQIVSGGGSLGVLFSGVLTPAVHGLLVPLAALATNVLGSLITAFGVLMPVFANIDKEIIGVFIPIWQAVMQAIGPVINVLGDVFATVMQQTSIVLLSVGKDLQTTVMPALRQMEPTILPIIAAIGRWATQIGNILIPIIQILGTILSTVLPIAINFLVRSFEVVVAVVGFVWPTISAIISGALNEIQAVIKVFSDLFQGNWGALWGDVLNVFSTLVGSIFNILGTLTSSILGALGALFGKVLSTVGAGIAGFVGWWLVLPVRVVQAVGGLLGSLLGWLGGVFGGLLGAIGGGVGNAASAFGTLTNKAITALGGLAGQLAGVAGTWMSNLANGILQGIGVVLNAIANLRNQIISHLHSLVTDAKGALNGVPGLGGALNFAGFASGTLSAPGGLAIVGEGEEPELVVGPHLANVARGSGIFPLSNVGVPSGGGGGRQLIVVQLDGQTIASVVVQNTPREVWLATGMRGHV